MTFIVVRLHKGVYALKNLKIHYRRKEVRVEPPRHQYLVSSLVAARARSGQGHARRGGDLPGVLRLGSADHTHADRKYTNNGRRIVLHSMGRRLSA